MPSKYWIKLYHEILDDPKMARLNDHLWRRVIELFLLAGVENNEGQLPSVEDMAWKLRTTEEDLDKDLFALEDVGVTRHDTYAIWYVTNFNKRQAADSGTERWRRWKERQNKQKYYGEQTEDQQPTNDTLVDIDIDTDIDVDIESETDEEEEPNPDGIYSDLSIAFVNKTGIPELTGGPQKWYDSLISMGEAGVKAQDIEKAVDILRDRDYSIVRLSSVENTAIGEMSKRVCKGPDPNSEEARSRYVTGEYEDFIEH